MHLGSALCWHPVPSSVHGGVKAVQSSAENMGGRRKGLQLGLERQSSTLTVNVKVWLSLQEDFFT